MNEKDGLIILIAILLTGCMMQHSTGPSQNDPPPDSMTAFGAECGEVSIEREGLAAFGCWLTFQH